MSVLFPESGPRRPDGAQRGDFQFLAKSRQKSQISPRIARICQFLVATAAWAVVLGALANSAAAQPVQAAPAPAQDSLDAQFDDLFLMPDRSHLQWMRRAETLIEAQQYTDAVRFLSQILESDSDYFIRSPGGTTFLSFKGQAEDMIGKLPEAGIDAYERLFGSLAEKQLRAAVASGKTDELVECARRYFHTPAGARATWLLGQYFLDHGQPLSAATTFQRLKHNAFANDLEPQLSLSLSIALWRTGREDEATQSAKQLSVQFPNASFEMAGRRFPVLGPNDRVLDWLANAGGRLATATSAINTHWLLPQGCPAGAPVVNADRPVSVPRWSLPTSNQSETLKQLARLQTEYASQTPPIAALPSAIPLAVGDYVLVRTLDSLVAVDVKTGKRVFPISLESGPDARAISDSVFTTDESVMDLVALEQRLLDDQSYSKITSDGEAVYFVASTNRMRPAHQLFLPDENGVYAGSFDTAVNWLEARDLSTDGKLMWTLGGPKNSGNPLAGAMFLGPPLPLDGILYCIVEWEGTIQLVALNPRAEFGGASLLWRQQLAATDLRPEMNTGRRLTGATPSFSDGLLICPTSAGAIVAIDLSTKSLRWGFKYQQDIPTYAFRTQRLSAAGRSGFGFDRWLDSTPVIKDGRVYLTPTFSERLYCLDLITGESLWTAPRVDGLYLAAVTADTAYVVGAHQVVPFAVVDGERKSRVPLPAGVTPSGRGLQTPGRYLLPLSSSEIASINLDTGELAERIPLIGIPGAPKLPLGNLIAFQGSIISQSIQSVDCFDQLDSLRQQTKRQLTANPNDAAALTGKAIVQLETGERTQAITTLQESYRQQKDELTRILLVNHLRSVLRDDFAANRHLNNQVAELLETDEERSDFLTDVAYGLYTTGEYRASFEAYLELADLLARQPRLEEQRMRRMERGWTVRDENYLSARIMNLYAMAEDADREQMDKLIAARLPEAVAATEQLDRAANADRIFRLEQFIRLFNGHPLANTARLTLAQRLTVRDPRSPHAELLYREVWRGGDNEQRVSALFALADRYLESGDPELAHAMARQLSQTLDNTETDDADKARLQQLNARLSAAPTGSHDWGAWDGKSPEEGVLGSMEPIIPIARDTVQFVPGLTSSSGRVSWDPQSGELLMRDSLGETRWTLTLDAEIGLRRYMPPQSYRYGMVGQLALVTIGDSLTAVNTAGGSASVIGTSTFSATMGSDPASEIRAHSMTHPWGELREDFNDSQNRPLGRMAFLGENMLCVLRGREISALPPTLDGPSYWQRRMPEDIDSLFGSAERMFAVKGETATVLRASDGEILGTRAVPNNTDLVTTLGDCAVQWLGGGAEPVQIRLLDCWRGTEDNPAIVWVRDFAAGARAKRLDGQRLAILEPSGQFCVTDLQTGKDTLTLTLEPEQQLTDVAVIEGPDSLIVVGNTFETFERERSVTAAFPAPPEGIKVNGWVYAIDPKKQELLWKRKIGNHGLWLGQPTNLPVLAFACSANLRMEEQRIRANAILLLDRRSGAVIYESNAAMAATGAYQITGKPETNTVEIRLPNTQQLTLKFGQPAEKASGDETKTPELP